MTSPHTPHRRTHFEQRGFTLVELLVSVLLGLLTTLVITQVLLQAEGKKRTIAMGGDAQVNGALALYTLQRDIQMAGYGVAANTGTLGCSIKGRYATTAVEFPLAPVTIADGANGAPDSVTVLQAQPTNIGTPVLVKENFPGAGQTYLETTSTIGLMVNDMILAIPRVCTSTDWARIFQITADPSTATRIPLEYTNGWNSNEAIPTAGFPANSYVINLGALVHRTYQISNEFNLQAAELSPADGTYPERDLFPQVVNMQAMYGKDTNNDDQVDTYDNVTPTNAAEWAKVMNIRLALVTRSHQYEKTIVTTAAPLWDVGSTATIANTTDCHDGSQCLTLRVDQVTDWQHYRYKINETVIPLRNILWNS